jgi:hypothetical protein
MALSLLALSVALVPALLWAQVNTTGSLTPTTPIVQTQAPAPTTVTTPPPTVTAPPTTTTTTPGPTTTATTPVARDAAIVICGEEFSTGTNRLLVSSASTSAGGPTIAPGSACAQALADLFAAGFGVIDVLPLNQQVQYTLVR